MEEFDFHSLLIIDTHFLSPVGAALPRRKANARAVVPLLIGAHIICCLCIPRVLFVPLALVRQRFSYSKL